MTARRKVLKLFRDYVFHQADSDGNPVLDLGHVISCLNKLDAADPEKIVLTSRDGASLLVVSYADVARCLEESYEELCRADTSIRDVVGVAQSSSHFHGSGGVSTFTGASRGVDKSATRFSPRSGKQPGHRNILPPPYHPSASQQQNVYTNQHQW